MPETAWNGAEVVCDKCGSKDVIYLTDEEHDGGDCEVFHCNSCGKSIHIEMPD